MKVAAIELHVEVSKRRPAAGEVSDGDAVMRALRARPEERNAIALGAIEVAAAFEPAVIVCPGWTFVGRVPRAAALARAAGGAVVLYEVLADRAEPRPRAGAAGKGEPRRVELPWRALVFDGGESTELPEQAIATAGELEEGGGKGAARLAAALKDGRTVAGGIVLLDAEVNAVRRLVQPGAPVRYAWDARVASAGVAERELLGALVLNPAHTPSGSYVRDKRRAGPWRALVSTANTLDRTRLGRTPLAPPAQAVVGGRDVAPLDAAAGDDRGSRVVVYDVAG